MGDEESEKAGDGGGELREFPGLVFYSPDQAVKATKGHFRLLVEVVCLPLRQVLQPPRKVNKVLRFTQGCARDVEKMQVVFQGLTR